MGATAARVATPAARMVDVLRVERGLLVAVDAIADFLAPFLDRGGGHAGGQRRQAGPEALIARRRQFDQRGQIVLVDVAVAVKVVCRRSEGRG